MPPERQRAAARIIPSSTDSHNLGVAFLAAYIPAQVVSDITEHVPARADLLRVSAIVPSHVHPTATANDSGLYYLLGAGQFLGSHMIETPAQSSMSTDHPISRL